MKLIEGALRAKPDESELWLFRGRYRVEAGDCRGASRDFERAIALAGDNPGAHSALGLARLCAGDRAGARAEFERSLQIDPAQPVVRDYLERARSPR
jgi:Flp pilus assembly protein TadD